MLVVNVFLSKLTFFPHYRLESEGRSVDPYLRITFIKVHFRTLSKIPMFVKKQDNFSLEGRLLSYIASLKGKRSRPRLGKPRAELNPSSSFLGWIFAVPKANIFQSTNSQGCRKKGFLFKFLQSRFSSKRQQQYSLPKGK